jgi:hypothetical protein
MPLPALQYVEELILSKNTQFRVAIRIAFCCREWEGTHGAVNAAVASQIPSSCITGITQAEQLLWRSNLSLRLRSSRRWLWRMPFSGMWPSVALVKTDVSEKPVASIISVLLLLVTANAFPSPLILFNLSMEAKRSSETSYKSHTTSNPIIWHSSDLSLSGINYILCEGNYRNAVRIVFFSITSRSKRLRSSLAHIQLCWSQHRLPHRPWRQCHFPM